MSRKGGNAPAPPDPVATAQAQTQMNRDTAITEQNLNMVDQQTPYGSLNYQQIGSWADGTPRYQATQNLSPEQQAIFDQNNQTQLGLATLANNQTNFLQDYMSQPIDLSNDATESRIIELQRERLDPMLAEQDEQLRTRLANQGIRVGTAAYDRELERLGQTQNDARNRLLIDARSLAQQEALTQRNQPINEISALLSGSQVSQPNYVGTPQASVANVDYAGLVNNNYNQQVAAHNQRQARQDQIMGGLFGLGANAIMAFSDKRLKRDIKKVGELDGHSLYRYRYKGDLDDGRSHVGVMAQDIEKVRPEVVVTHADGSKAVKYGELFGAAA